MGNGQHPVARAVLSAMPVAQEAGELVRWVYCSPSFGLVGALSSSLKVSLLCSCSRGFKGYFLLPRKLSIPKMKGGKGKASTKKETPEALKPVDDRKAGKRKAAVKADKTSQSKAKKDKKAKKDPNKPKRPPSAFFVFLEEFREIYKKEHPNVKAVSAVGKAGGEKWKSLTRAEKAPYEAKAAKRKSEYEKKISAYNKKQESNVDDGDEESDRSKSEINDEDDEESGEDDDDGDDEDDE